MSLYIPISLNIIIISYLKNNIIFITNKNFLIHTNYNSTYTYFDLYTTNFNALYTFTNIFNNLYSNYFKDFNKLLIAWNKIYIAKIKFKGKGYKFTKQTYKLTLYFNHSHITEAFFINTFFYRQRKYKFILINKNHTILQKIVNQILQARKINKYTKRGLRLSRSYLYKRKGKTNITIK